MPSNLPRLVTRVPDDLHNKFLEICKKEDRTSSNLLAHIVKTYVDEYEAINGNQSNKHLGKSSNLKSG
jgi:metal-responsive CopG/Arc/MetJ family transcriptional regulator